jgi:hypothetical protein
MNISAYDLAARYDAKQQELLDLDPLSERARALRKELEQLKHLEKLGNLKPSLEMRGIYEMAARLNAPEDEGEK